MNAGNRRANRVFGLYGAGGMARDAMPVVREMNHALPPEERLSFYFVETQPATREVNGVTVLSETEFFELPCEERLFNVAIGDSRVRQKIADRCIERGAKPMNVVSSHSIIYDYNEIGDGALLCANTMITSNVKIGRFFQSNIYSYVTHDCVIGDFVTFAPNVHCNGTIHIQDHAYLGTGAIIRQGTREKPLIIGEGAVVGMGAVVTKDVPPFATVVGNPARLMEKK